MRRVQFIELHEQPWFPASLRADVTDALQFGFNLLHAYAPIAPLLQSMIDSRANGKHDPLANDPDKHDLQTNDRRTSARNVTARQSIIDLCSGGGGPWQDLSRELHCSDAANSAALRIWLTDKYPNLAAFQSIGASSDHQITYYPESVDAMKVPDVLKGLRTMFTSFHHFSPEDARAILQNAVDAGESIGIFEATKRAPSTIALIFAGILLMFLHTPRIRPFRWSRLLWTYLLPIIPLVLLFDGVVSCLRTYRPDELRKIVDKLTCREYQWEIGEVAKGKMPVTYLIGYPK